MNFIMEKNGLYYVLFVCFFNLSFSLLVPGGLDSRIYVLL